MPSDSKPSQYSDILLQSELVTIGHFHCPQNSEDFHTAGTIYRPTLVFPRTQMWIQKENRSRYLSHPNLVNFYDGQQTYERQKAREYDDICDWFEFSPAAIAQAFEHSTHSAVDDLNASFDGIELDFDHGFCNPDIYLAQRAIVADLQNGVLNVDDAKIRSMELLEDIFTRQFKQKSNLSQQKRLRYHDIVEKAEEVIFRDLEQKISLESLARILAISPFHLCRVFKLINGVSILDFKIQARLRYSMDALSGTRDITELALNHGFSSHSHYSTKFKKVFGCTPAQYRKASM